MDSILKSLHLGFLLRCLFAGAYFVVAYQFTSGGSKAFMKLDSSAVLSVALPVALLAGVTIYSLHRSVVYPGLEYVLNSDTAIGWRQCAPFISTNTKLVLKSQWSIGVEKEKANAAIVSHFTTWADHTHLQYASGICLALGSMACRFFEPGEYIVSWPIVFAVSLFVGSGLLSDWRLHSVREAFGIPPHPPHSASEKHETAPPGKPGSQQEA